MTNVNGYVIVLVFLLTAGASLFLIFTLFRTMQQTAIRKALIEKFGSAQNLGELLQTSGGQRLLADLPNSGGSPLQSVLSSVQKGILGLLVGLGGLFVGAVSSQTEMVILGSLFACAGLAFFWSQPE
jgi:hypothetical protein